MGESATEIRLRVEGHRLPGLRWACHDRVHVGLQCRRDPVSLVPGDAGEAVFTLTFRLLTADDGTLDFRGPYVQGRRGDRFFYLTWGNVPEGGEFTMFRRSKLRFADIPEALLRQAAADGSVLRIRLPLTGADGSPRCAAIRPPEVCWEAVPAG